MDKGLFRQVLGLFATGITVVTTRQADDTLHGLTINSFTSVSLTPPLVLICVERRARSHEFIAQSGAFAVNFLSEQQEIISERFSARAPLVSSSFEGIPYRIAATGSPILEGCLGWVDCRVWATYDGGDHTIFVGQVEALGLGEGSLPLLYYRGRYMFVEPE
ncbi:MAG: flavin reductase family protein [Anaerolineae bacterium]|nr:flavin reductase family protein [Anaerolineae bacterium]